MHPAGGRVADGSNTGGSNTGESKLDGNYSGRTSSSRRKETAGRLPTPSFWVAAFAAAATAFGTALPASAGEPELRAAVQKLSQAAGFGEGARAAGAAWKQAVDEAQAKDLPIILAGLDDATPLGANYLRSAAQFVFERDRKAAKPIPKDLLEAFVFSKHDPRARRTAYEWVVELDSTAPDRLLPKLVNDSSVELRRDAVARVLAQAEADLKAEKKEAAHALFKTALAAARDDDQVKQATGQLKTLGETVDLPRHFGFLMDWNLIGPFDNTGKKGFPIAYPPERELDFKSKYPGKGGAECVWKHSTTSDEYGVVDLNALLGKHKGSLCYAEAEFTMDRDTPAEIRLGCVTAWKLWLNGKALFEREEYHRGFVIDQYRVPCTLEEGRNVLLLKVCQNEQTEEWAQRWQFQLRLCDSAGTAILASDRPATPAPKPEAPKPEASKADAEKAK